MDLHLMVAGSRWSDDGPAAEIKQRLAANASIILVLAFQVLYMRTF